MVHVGLDLSRTRLDVHVMDEAGAPLAVTTAVPDSGGLAALAGRIGGFGGPVYAAIESMNGARFVHDQLEMAGWQVEIADAQKVKGLAPLACKTDKIDAWVLAELSRRDLVPAIWLPTPTVRAERERARWRLHLVRHRTALKNRIHATLLAFGHPCPVSDLFGVGGRELLARLALPEPWAADTAAALHLIDQLDAEIAECERACGSWAPITATCRCDDHPRDRLGARLHHRRRDRRHHPLRQPDQAGRLHRAVPGVYQSGGKDHRGPLAKNGPKSLRWALIEAAAHAARHPVYADRYRRTKTRLGRQRGPKVARVDLARRLAEAIWHMLSTNNPSPRQAPRALAS